jgi:hypothetical protein
MMKATSTWCVWQRDVPAGIASLGYTVGEGMADGVGAASAGEGVGVECGMSGTLETVTDGFVEAGGEGVHEARTIAIIPMTSPNRPRPTLQNLRRSNGWLRRR